MDAELSKGMGWCTDSKQHLAALLVRIRRGPNVILHASYCFIKIFVSPDATEGYEHIFTIIASFSFSPLPEQAFLAAGI